MTYADTARDYVQAENNNHAAHGGEAAARLTMSAWAEDRRDKMTPQTIAMNHAVHVGNVATVLRNALRPADFDWFAALERGRVSYRSYRLECAARALLVAIGEGE